jgi:hypothetical protein
MTEDDKEIHALLHRQHYFQAFVLFFAIRTRRRLLGEDLPEQAQASQLLGYG